jgi:hypothetical protein
MYRSVGILLLSALAMPVTTGTAVVIGLYPHIAQAQTEGMQRREDRRGTRQDAREDKRECNASGDSSRSGCRQEKRDVRQTGREDRTGTNPVGDGAIAPQNPNR